MNYDQLREQYQLDGHYPRNCASVLDEAEDMAYDFSEYAYRSIPEPPKRPISRADHDRIARRYYAAYQALELYHQSGSHNVLDGQLEETQCPVCGPVKQILYWSGRCYGCIIRELREARREYRNLRHYQVEGSEKK